MRGYRGEEDLGQSTSRPRQGVAQGAETPRAESHISGISNAELRQVMTLIREMQSEIRQEWEQRSIQDQPPLESRVGAAMGSAAMGSAGMGGGVRTYLDQFNR